MQVKLINCNTRLIALGIDMQVIGSGDLLTPHLPSGFDSWEYNLISDILVISMNTPIPDLSNLGEVVPNDISG